MAGYKETSVNYKKANDIKPEKTKVTGLSLKSMLSIKDTLKTKLQEIRDNLIKDNEFRLLTEREKIAYIHACLDFYNELLRVTNEYTKPVVHNPQNPVSI